MSKSSSKGFSEEETSPFCSPTTTSESWDEEAFNAVTASGEMKYGYEEAAPDLARPCRSDSCATLDSATKNEYGYEDAAPSTPGGKTSRRSSLKGANGPPTPKRHSITFSNHVLVSPVVPTTEMIKKKSELWFQRKDYDKIKAKIYAIADLAAEGEIDKKICTRGLESLIVKDSALQRYEAWNAVLDEQWNQIETGDYDDQALSTVYKLSSVNSQMQAKLRASQDEKDIKKYTFDTRQYCRRFSL